MPGQFGWGMMARVMDEGTRIMAIETSAGLGSVALARGPQLLREQLFTGKLRHAGELLPTMAKLTKELGWSSTDIEHVYVSAGPGSFTGLRIAITTVKALAFAQPQLKIVAVPSTDALVLNVLSAQQGQNLKIKYYAVVIDAKREQIYTAIYEKVDSEITSPGGTEQNLTPGFRTVAGPMVMRPKELLDQNYRPLGLLGEGIRLHRQKLTAEGVVFLDEGCAQPRASQVHRCGWRRARAGMFTDVDELIPFYLRRPEAVERWEKAHRKEKQG